MLFDIFFLVLFPVPFHVLFLFLFHVHVPFLFHVLFRVPSLFLFHVRVPFLFVHVHVPVLFPVHVHVPFLYVHVRELLVLVQLHDVPCLDDRVLGLFHGHVHDRGLYTDRDHDLGYGLADPCLVFRIRDYCPDDMDASVNLIVFDCPLKQYEIETNSK